MALFSNSSRNIPVAATLAGMMAATLLTAPLTLPAYAQTAGGRGGQGGTVGAVGTVLSHYDEPNSNYPQYQRDEDPGCGPYTANRAPSQPVINLLNVDGNAASASDDCYDQTGS